MNDKYLLYSCETGKQKSDVFKLRYQAYRSVGAINENTEEEFKDRYDLLENSKTCVVYEKDTAVASLRACIYSREHNFLQLPGFEVYKEEIEKAIGLDKTIVEFNRFVIDREKANSKILFKLPLRFTLLNVLKFKGDYAIGAVRAKHAPLYKRIFNMEPISGPKRYPGINVEMIMMASNCRINLPAVMDNDEMFRFTEEEVNAYLSETFPVTAP